MGRGSANGDEPDEAGSVEHEDAVARGVRHEELGVGERRAARARLAGAPGLKGAEAPQLCGAVKQRTVVEADLRCARPKARLMRATTSTVAGRAERGARWWASGVGWGMVAGASRPPYG
eukprot:1978778-Prymnesium_polylepis.1